MPPCPRIWSSWPKRRPLLARPPSNNEQGQEEQADKADKGRHEGEKQGDHEEQDQDQDEGRDQVEEQDQDEVIRIRTEAAHAHPACYPKTTSGHRAELTGFACSALRGPLSAGRREAAAKTLLASDLQPCAVWVGLPTQNARARSWPNRGDAVGRGRRCRGDWQELKRRGCHHHGR